LLKSMPMYPSPRSPRRRRRGSVSASIATSTGSATSEAGGHRTANAAMSARLSSASSRRIARRALLRRCATPCRRRAHGRVRVAPCLLPRQRGMVARRGRAPRGHPSRHPSILDGGAHPDVGPPPSRRRARVPRGQYDRPGAAGRRSPNTLVHRSSGRDGGSGKKNCCPERTCRCHEDAELLCPLS
jgi:hypothetical protein